MTKSCPQDNSSTAGWVGLPTWHPDWWTIGIMEPPGTKGLIAPFATDVAPILMPLATVGRAVVVTGAVVTHVRRKEPVTVQRGLGLLAVASAPLRSPVPPDPVVVL